MRICIVILVTLATLGGCATYGGNGEEPECYTLADCNPGKECGEMVKCVDGKCDPNQTENLPCEQSCTSDQDCPAGMHCRAGECVLDGTCVDDSECLGLPTPDIDCAGRYSCDDGVCVFHCETEVDWYACDADSDCVKVAADCCGCQNGGGENAVNKNYAEDYQNDLNDVCALVDIDCAAYDACTTWEAICHQGRCMTLREKCGCGNVWDPVCGGTGAMMYTFGSECEADCVDMPWYYHGNCNCAMDCGLGMQVCANNGQSYWCGEWEAQCNGQTVHYPGECSQECEICDMLGRPSIPVCGEDFRYYSDMCYAECHELQWWHHGECLPGEGQVCNIEGSTCASDDLYCQTYGCFSCTGTCIAVGSCLQPDDCMGQPLVADDCEGHWTCPDHVCNWVCD